MTLRKQYRNIVADAITYQQQEDSFMQIVDDNAIEFGKWLNNQVINKKGTHYHLNGKVYVNELYAVYKQIKGL
jgi:hypothetical protein